MNERPPASLPDAPAGSADVPNRPRKPNAKRQFPPAHPFAPLNRHFVLRGRPIEDIGAPSSDSPPQFTFPRNCPFHEWRMETVEHVSNASSSSGIPRFPRPAPFIAALASHATKLAASRYLGKRVRRDCRDNALVPLPRVEGQHHRLVLFPLQGKLLAVTKCAAGTFIARALHRAGELQSDRQRFGL